MTIHDLEMSQKVVQLEELTKKLNIANQELVNLSTVVQKTSNSVIITDAKGQIKWVNNGFENTTEYRLADVIGKKPGSFLQGKMTKIESISKIKKALLEKTSISEEILNYKKSGSPYWSALTITPIFDKKSKVVNYISIQSDITNLKIQQQKLEEYVFLNSHILRGSLCRVSGLAYLLSNDLAKDDFEIVIQKLVESMNEFDIITKEINVLLEDENYYEGKYLNLLENLKT